MREKRKSSARRRAGTGTMVMLAMLAILGGVAFATATSGYVDNGSITFNNGAVGRKCVKADIVDVADNRAWARAGNGGCGSGFSVPAGYLGAHAYGYRSGAYCGQTGTAYSPWATSEFGVGAVLCSNPGGLQSFYTNAYGYFYQGPSYPYNNGYVIGSASSPSQSY